MRGVMSFVGWSFFFSVLLWKFAPMMGLDVDDIPGTVTFQSGSTGIRIPILFCVVTSVVLTLIMTAIRKLRR